VDLFAYHDASGSPVIYVKRTNHQDGSKRFCQWGPTADNLGWQAKLDYAPKPRPLYRLPAIIAAAEKELVVFHEGEKATEAAINAGLPGTHTTTIGGAGNPHHSEFSPLVGRNIVVCPDNDDDGERYAAAVTQLANKSQAKSVSILRLPGLPPKGDVVEWLASGGTSAQFAELLNQIQSLNPTGPSGPGGPLPVPGRSDVLAGGKTVCGPEHAGPVHLPAVPGYRIADDGVFELPRDEEKPEVRLTHAKCGVVALCRDGRRENWGAYVRWMDRDGVSHEAAFPVGRFHESGGILPAELANLGLPIVPGMEKRLLRYLANCNPKTRFRAAIQTGWQDGTAVFVLPAGSIGHDTGGERIVYQPERFAPTGHSVRTKGTLLGWQMEVAAQCEKNPVLAFFVAASLAAPLLHLLEQEGGGFHLYGQTSKGKTTAEQVAASVWGDGSDPATGRNTAFVKKWNQTKNATEGLAQAHTDLPLCLDEVGEADAREFGRIIYQLAGGQGKGRMRADATLAQPKVWRIILLSTGELPASDVIEAEGKTIKSGQAVRLIDIPAIDPMTGDGIIAETHGESDPALFVDRLKRSCGSHYGWAGPAFVQGLLDEGLTAVQAELQAVLRETVQAMMPSGASAEVQRAVKRFALVCVAGEKAVNLRILPWTPGEVVRAARVLLARYLSVRGGAGCDTERAIDRIKGFLLAHGSSRFRELDKGTDRIINLAGYRDIGNGVYYFTSDGFKEACRGYDVRDVARLLITRGFLRTPDAGHLTERVTVPEVGRTRLYTVLDAILDSTHSEALNRWTGPHKETVLPQLVETHHPERLRTDGPLGPVDKPVLWQEGR
jgi:uncharacterized protein (DUF927 family)